MSQGHGESGVSPLLEVYQRLYHAYGPQHWWPGDSPFKVIIGAILTQSTAWSNVEKAMHNLKTAGVLSPQGLRDIPREELAALLRPSGYFNIKAKKLKAFINHLWEHYQGDLDSFLARDTAPLRRELLSIYGIGEETADDIVLYAAGKPSFVIDAYTRRILNRLGLGRSAATYPEYQELFRQALPRDPSLYNEYHALLVRHGKDVCKKRPLCSGCCLLEECPTGAKAVREKSPASLR